ncbi:hypothetical protein EJ02DRAFT_452870 [Clathrospora elynae]|uniref:Uncharacterized protein n=1 Tax=Clathrospora elynae TaxID=706981 RepID=A0A6A5SW47_9PLEO|nr:hypothetical protein EJ02DRAFT_452870 [Clathrospora elynae]
MDPMQSNSFTAVSCANSLFIVCPDPYGTIAMSMSKSIQRILENISKPGLTFLLPLWEPMMREVNTDSWRLDSYHSFNGTPARSFETTSVHISFTEYHIPHYDGSRGAHDNQIPFLKSVVSVQDKGQWVADVDPLPLIDHVIDGRREAQLRRLAKQGPCSHTKESNPNRDITAVDTWDELIDRPDGVFVVRTGNNLVAMLALTLVAFQRMRETFPDFAITICALQICWTCTQQAHRHHAYIYVGHGARFSSSIIGRRLVQTI